MIKSKDEIETMRKAGKIAGSALELAGSYVKPGISTIEIDRIIKEYILNSNAKPSFLGYGGFPASSCISINEIVIHGIPDKRIICDGDIVSIDIGAYFNGVHADCAATFAAGEISKEAKRLIEVTKQSFFEGIKFAKAGQRVGDIGATVADYVQKYGYSVVRQYVGHGVGFELHEDPAIPNYGNFGKGTRLSKGMTIAIEPMVNEGVFDVNVLEDGWSVVTADGRLSAHYEHTIAITDGEPDILTNP